MRAPLRIRLYRLFRLVLHLSSGVALAGVVLPVVAPKRRDRLASSWASRLLDILNIRLSIHRRCQIPAAHAAVYVANHISWIDVLALYATRPARFIAKSEVQAWPLIGRLVIGTGTLFIGRRKFRDILTVLDAMRALLRGGNRVAFFPEGTTTAGSELKPFRSGLLQAAVDTAALVCPVAIRYPNPDGSNNPAPAFVGDTSLVRALWRVAGEESLHMTLDFAKPISARSRNRKDLARDASAQIAASLHLSAPAPAITHGRAPEPCVTIPSSIPAPPVPSLASIKSAC